MEQEKDLWKLVRQKLNKDQTVEQKLEEKEEPHVKGYFYDTTENEIKDVNSPVKVEIKERHELEEKKNVLQLLNE